MKVAELPILTPKTQYGNSVSFSTVFEGQIVLNVMQEYPVVNMK